MTQKLPRQGVHKGLPYLPMKTDLGGRPAEAARTLHSFCQGSLPRFVVCRSILQTPTWYARVEQELKRLAGDSVTVVDLYTLLWLVREWETNPGNRPVSPYARAAALKARPNQAQGLAPLAVGDGPFTVGEQAGSPCWRTARHQPPCYLYFDVDNNFACPSGTPLEIQFEYLDAGTGPIVLEYDSTDARAPVAGAYKPHPQVLHRAGTGQWRQAVFPLNDARFSGRQNGEADFRFFNGGDDLWVRAVTLRRVPQ